MDIKVNLKNWSLRQYRDFTVAVKDGDIDKILYALTLVVDAWGYDGNPKDVDYWLDNLNVEEWMGLVPQITDQLSKAFNSKN